MIFNRFGGNTSKEKKEQEELEKKKKEIKNTNLKKFLIIVPGLSLTLVSDEVAVVVTTVLADGLTVFERNHREKLQMKRP